MEPKYRDPSTVHSRAHNTRRKKDVRPETKVDYWTTHLPRCVFFFVLLVCISTCARVLRFNIRLVITRTLESERKANASKRNIFTLYLERHTFFFVKQKTHDTICELRCV